MVKGVKGEGEMSPSCRSKLEKFIVFPSKRAGVPVCSRWSLNPAAFKEAERPMEGASFILPAGNRFMPRECKEDACDQAQRSSPI